MLLWLSCMDAGLYYPSFGAGTNGWGLQLILLLILILILCIIQRKVLNKRSRSLWHSIANPKPITVALSLSPVINERFVVIRVTLRLGYMFSFFVWQFQVATSEVLAGISMASSRSVNKHAVTWLIEGPSGVTGLKILIATWWRQHSLSNSG